ncbi:hypothetical protein Tco_1051902, partial [Tanacetum coccineum]
MRGSSGKDPPRGTNDEIFENLALMGYEQPSTKLTFQKGSFSPQWKFLIYNILQCISSKSTAWNEFSTNLASAVICLAKGQKFNFSKLIFDGMIRNLDSKKFLMYPRFLQLFLNNQLKDLPEPFNDTYVTPCHTKKVFSNMARKSVNFSGNITPLFASMLVQNQVPEGEAPQTEAHQTEAHQTAVSQIVFHEAHIEQILSSLTTYQRKRKTQKCRRPKKDTELPQTSVPLDHGADEVVHKEEVTVAVLGAKTPWGGEGKMEHTIELTDNVPSTPYDSPLLGGYTSGSDEAVEILNLNRRVKKLERKRKSSISHPRRRKYRQVETSSKDGLDEEDASKQGRRSDKLKPMFKDKDFEELDDYIENVEEETVDAAAIGVSTVSAPVSTVGVTISTAEPRTPPTTTTVFDNEDVTMEMAHTLIKMKEQKAKEKGVAITDVEDSSRIVKPVRSITTLQPLLTIDPKDKDKDLAQRLNEEELSELERAQQERQRQEDDTNAALAKEFDEIQVRIDVDYELAKVDSSSKTAGGSRKKTLAEKRAGEIKEQESAKKQKLEDVAEEQESAKSDEEAATDYEHEKEELRMWLIVVSDEEETVDPKILSAKYPIVDWESQNLGSVDMEDLHVYKIIRADGNTSY